MSQLTALPAARSVLPVALTLSCAFLMEQLLATIIVAAIPAMALDFGVAPLRINIAISVYLVTVAAMIPASSWAADRFGAKRVFLIAIAAFTLTSLAAAFAPDLNTMIALRVLQGIAGAMMTPVGRLLLIRAARPEDLAAAIAWMSMPALIGPVLGPLLAGVIVTHFTWHWIFIAVLPFGLIGVIAAWRILPPDAAAEAPPKFDGYGFALCLIFFASAQAGIDQLVSPYLPRVVTWTLCLALVVSLALYLRHARAKARPALDLSLLKLRLFRAGFFAGGLSRIGLNAVPFLLQLQLQLGFGWSAAKAGATVFAVAAGALVLKPLMRRVLAALGFRRTLSWNAYFGAAMTGAIALVQPQTAQWVILVLVLIYGVSRSLQFNAVNTVLYADIPRERQSASTALGGVSQQLAMGFGISLAAVLVAQLQNAGVTVTASAISLSLWIMAALTALSGLIFALSLTRTDGALVSGHGASINKRSSA